MTTSNYVPRPRKLLPDWMIGATDRVMDYYIKRYLHCDPIILKNPPPPQEGHRYLLYAHIPFCHTLCTYCTFHRFLFKEYKAREYFVNLRKEMEYVHALGYDFHSMYIGGGTTTILEDELIKTIEHAKKLFPSIKEISCETDPQIITTPQFRNLKGLVDRMSIGVQSFNDEILKLSDRYEKFGSGEQIFERLQYAQELFPTCNVDMMFGFRGQTLDMLHDDMEKIWQLNPRQVTTYPLMVTSQTRKSVKNDIAAKGNQLADQYRVILDTLGSRYNHLTSWTFGRTNDEGFDEYVVDYDEYLGVGSGAFSFLGDSLYEHLQPSPLCRTHRAGQHRGGTPPSVRRARYLAVPPDARPLLAPPLATLLPRSPRHQRRPRALQGNARVAPCGRHRGRPERSRPHHRDRRREVPRPRHDEGLLFGHGQRPRRTARSAQGSRHVTLPRPPPGGRFFLHRKY